VGFDFMYAYLLASSHLLTCSSKQLLLMAASVKWPVHQLT